MKIVFVFFISTLAIASIFYILNQSLTIQYAKPTNQPATL